MLRLFLLTCCTFRSKTNALNICQKMIEMFVRTKHKIDKRHEFALVVVNDDALWVSGEASQPSCALSARLKHVCMCVSYQASPLTPGSCAAACMTSTPMCVNLLVSFESFKMNWHDTCKLFIGALTVISRPGRSSECDVSTVRFMLPCQLNGGLNGD